VHHDHHDSPAADAAIMPGQWHGRPRGAAPRQPEHRGKRELASESLSGGAGV
jgi:hypothetical protein